MALNTYNSFEEIDQRLKILNLQRKIHRESIKISLNNAKTNFYPNELLGGISRFMQKIALTFAIKKLSRISGLLRTFRRDEGVKILE